MAPTVQATARIFEDPEPAKTSKSHKRIPSVGDVLRGRRKENSPTKSIQQKSRKHASPSPLGERHINSPPQPKKVPLKGDETSRPPMHKKTGSSTSLKGFLMGRDKTGDENSGSTNDKLDGSPKKKKSSTNLVGLLKKRSKKDLKDTEDNYTPSSLTPVATPIWAQFATQPLEAANGAVRYPHAMIRTQTGESGFSITSDHSRSSPSDQSVPQTPAEFMDYKPPQRPFLEHKSSRSSIFTENLDEDDIQPALVLPKSRDQSRSRPSSSHNSPVKVPVKEPSSPSPEKAETKAKQSSRILNTIATLNMKFGRDGASSPKKEISEKAPLSPQELDSAMENMLGRYDVPQNLRDQLRNLKPEVKAGLMKGDRIGSGSSTHTDIEEKLRPSSRKSENERPSSKEHVEKEGKGSRSSSRPRSRVFSMSKRNNENSPSKQDGSGRSRSKIRPRSIDMSRPALGGNTAPANPIATPDCATTPGDFIHYLREVQKPELVEVGKIHKLRILLRNEAVTWTDAFVKKGGMDEIVQLLYRIMKIEWREEHEDNLLHETLLCLKGISTTSLAMQRLEMLAAELFPALLKMLFDPERKGPAEYGTRGVVISLIFAYLSATLQEGSAKHYQRTLEVLDFLKDPTPENDKQPLDFVSQMHIARPYRVWWKEVSNLTKEVFWIFLHHMNVVPILDAVHEGESSYIRAYFPSARAPHPAAPYVGGVEWEATQYLATHLDLMNALIVSLPSSAERNSLREDMRQSGWEKVMGGSLRTCKEKFYGGVHDGLKAWVAAAHRDGWPVEDVRSGPPRDTASPRKSPMKKNHSDEAPKIALNVGAPILGRQDDDWL